MSGRQPAADESVQVFGIEIPEYLRKGGCGGNRAAPESECVGEPMLAESAELGDGSQTGMPGQDRDQTQRENQYQRVANPSAVTRVGQLPPTVRSATGS